MRAGSVICSGMNHTPDGGLPSPDEELLSTFVVTVFKFDSKLLFAMEGRLVLDDVGDDGGGKG